MMIIIIIILVIIPTNDNYDQAQHGCLTTKESYRSVTVMGFLASPEWLDEDEEDTEAADKL